MKKITRKTVTMAAAALMTMSALTGCSGKQAVQAVDLTAVSFDEIQKKAREEDRSHPLVCRTTGQTGKEAGKPLRKNMV